MYETLKKVFDPVINYTHTCLADDRQLPATNSSILLNLGKNSTLPIAYDKIPRILANFVRQQPARLWDWRFLLYSVFMLLCSIGYFITIWMPQMTITWLNNFISSAFSLRSWDASPTLPNLQRQLPQLSLGNPTIERDRTACETEHHRLPIQPSDRPDNDKNFELKLLNQQYKQEITLLRALIANVPGIIYSLDTNGEITHLEGKGVENLGLPENCLGRSLFDLYRNQPYMVENLRHALTGIEHSWLAPTDNWVYEHRTTPLFHPTGEVKGLVGIATDITERVRVEDTLRLTQFSVDRCADAIFWIAPDAKLLYVNREACRSLGYSRQQLLSMSIHDINPDLPATAWDLHWNILSRCGSLTIECSHRTQDGRIFPVEMTINHLKFNGKEYQCAFVRDIRERKQVLDALRQSKSKQTRLINSLRKQTIKLKQALSELQQAQIQLIQTEKMSSLGQLVAGIAHEINNPVNFITGNLHYAEGYIQDLIDILNLYQEHCPVPIGAVTAKAEAVELDYVLEDLPKLLSSMKIGADRIRQIVLSLRNFSRLDESQKKPVDIHEGLDNTLLLLQNRFKDKPGHPGIQLIKAYGDLPKVECYAGQLNQVFMNLLSNAIDALEESFESKVLNAEAKLDPQESPKIWIRTEVLQGDRVAICIADNGPGIPSDVLQRLFDPFFTTKPVGKGTGLGLSISYQIVVERHRGQLQCVSTPGKGAEFRIEIPLSAA